MKKTKKVVAFIMAGIMSMSVVGCGKAGKKKEEVDKYNAVQQQLIEHSIYEMTIIDDVLYGVFTDYSDDSELYDSGIVKYDFASKELNEQIIENDNFYIESIYANADGQLVLGGTKMIEDNYSEEMPDADTDSDANANAESDMDKTEESTYTYQYVDYVYDKDLNQVSVNESEPITESYDVEDSDKEIQLGEVNTSDGITVTLFGDMMGENYSVKIKDKEGNEKSSFKLENEAGELYCLDGKKVLCSIYEDEKRYLYEVDYEKGKLGKQIVDVSKYYINSMYPGKDNSMMFVTSNSLFECDCNTGKVKKILNFMDCDVNPDRIQYVFVLSDGTLGVAMSNNDYDKLEIDFLYKQDPNQKSKKEIKLGVFFLDYDLQEDVIQYNKTHDDVRIVVKEYYGEDEDDYDKALSKFNSDISSGNCPDIIDFGSSMSATEEYIEKGLLEDLTPYFDKDEEVNIEDFVQSVVNTYKVDGKIYVLPEYFMINGFFGATSVVGKETGWTLDEFISFAKSFPEGTEVIPYGTREDALNMLCSYNQSQFVDWSTGECSFDKGDFAKLLEFCNTLVSQEDLTEEYWDTGVSEATKIRNKQQILYFGTMYSMEEYMVAKEIFGEEITFKSFPTSNGTGVVISPSWSKSLAISSKSKYKDEAWDFIRKYYLPDEQLNSDDMYYNAMGFPVRQDDLDKMFEKAKTPITYIDENGNEQTDYNTWEFEDISLTVPYPTDEDIAVIKNIINSIDTVAESNDKIVDIIEEEAAAFYKGQKSAEEVAKVVQSRVSVYVKENR